MWFTNGAAYSAVPESFRLVSNGERRMLVTGTRDWQDYRVTALLTPHAGEAMGVAVRVQGLERFYVVEADRTGTLRIVRRAHGDTVLAEAAFPWSDGEEVELGAELHGTTIRALVNGAVVAEASDDAYASGGIALTATTARVACDRVDVRPVE